MLECCRPGLTYWIKNVKWMRLDAIEVARYIVEVNTKDKKVLNRRKSLGIFCVDLTLQSRVNFSTGLSDSSCWCNAMLDKQGLSTWDIDTLLTSKADGKVPNQREHYHFYHCANHFGTWVTVTPFLCCIYLELFVISHSNMAQKNGTMISLMACPYNRNNSNNKCSFSFKRIQHRGKAI